MTTEKKPEKAAEKTTIQITTENRRRLEAWKQHPLEPINDVITRLIDFQETPHGENQGGALQHTKTTSNGDKNEMPRMQH